VAGATAWRKVEGEEPVLLSLTTSIGVGMLSIGESPYSGNNPDVDNMSLLSRTRKDIGIPPGRFEVSYNVLLTRS